MTIKTVVALLSTSLLLLIRPLAATGLPTIPQMMATQNMYQNNGMDLNDFSDLGTLKSMDHNEISGIDNAIDQDNYFIGMGDVFTISIIEMPSLSYTAKVNQNCDVHIAEFGLLKLGKLSLRDAKKAIVDFVHLKFKQNCEVYVALSKGKKASVTINGPVAKPGTYIMTGVFRVWDLILKSNGGVVPELNEIDVRNVQLQTSDTILNLDLLKYLLTNDLSENPYLYPGFKLFFTPIIRSVYVQGEVRNPKTGFISIKEGEKLNELLALFTLSSAADSGSIIVQKGATVATRRDTTVTIAESGAITLEDQDIITIPMKPNYPTIRVVTITGEIARPGPYSLHEGMRAEDLIALGGGYTPFAQPHRTYILRQSKKLSSTPPDNLSDPQIEQLINPTIGSIRPELNASFSRLYALNDYVVLAVGTDSLATTLESNDHIVVPRTEKNVYVSGAVKQPGGYTYKEGMNGSYYLECAGGLTNKGDRGNTYVINRYSSSLQVRSDQRIEQGDIIVVPDSQRNRFLTNVIVPILGAIASATTIMLTITSLAN